jgi:hypothetical protein
MKRQWQFSLASLLLTMLAVAVACAVFPYPRTAFYTLLAFLCLAAVLARFGPTRARAFWFWFSLCGWSYVVLGVSLLEAVEGTTFWHSTRDWLQKKSPAPDDWTPEHYLIFAHSLFAICVALTGAALAIFVRGLCGSLTIGNPPGGSTAHLEAKPEPSVATERSTAG